jgi:hypothetical protein
MVDMWFSRDRILRNIPISRGRLPRDAAEPPIFVGRQGELIDCVFGLQLDDPADIFYRVRRKPHQAWIEPTDDVHKITTTQDSPNRSNHLMYIYVQLSRIGKDEPALTLHLYTDWMKGNGPGVPTALGRSR